MNTLQQLFEHELKDVYYAEHELLDVLDELANQSERQELTEFLEDHREATQVHIDRIEGVFNTMGEPPEQEQCEGIQGLIEEHGSFRDEDPSQEILDVNTLTAARKTEHYEIAAGGNLARLADRLGMDEAGDLLHENPEEEEQAFERLIRLAEDANHQALTA